MKCFSDEWIEIELYKISRFCTTHGSYLVSRNLSEIKVVSSGRNCSFPTDTIHHSWTEEPNFGGSCTWISCLWAELMPKIR